MRWIAFLSKPYWSGQTMDEQKFDGTFDRMMNMMEKAFKWFPVFFAGFAIFWALLCITVVILVIAALTKYLNLW